ncbi:30S ribosomal protein S18-like [Hydractinia symbiolongicarpus]|uniref:30S ribosomal protein S18-like n=1 Tax=Hydractinia symbiolongicarpus TaxID=13093 RepID=UPI00254C75AA|nr:30S ribosomal protein S18-like [Hydractinia symbiolongicarpus]
MALQACGCLCKNYNTLLPLSWNALILQSSFFHLTTSDQYPKYRNMRKKARLHREKHALMKSKYERLDVEDRATGCLLCPHRNPDIDVDFKNVRLLSQFISPHTGRMYGRRITGLCGRKQIEITDAIKRARKIGLMPVTMKYFDYHGDPKLF